MIGETALGHGDHRTRAIAYAMRAGRQAITRFAYEEAAVHYRRALDLSRVEGEQAGDCELWRLIGDALRRAGDLTGAREAYGQAIEGARRFGSRAELARAALGSAGGLRALSLIYDVNRNV